MSSIARGDIIRMAREAGFYFHDAGYAPILHTVAGEYSEACFERFAALVAAAEREAGQRAFWEACRPHGKVGEVIYTTYKHIRARSTP